MTLPASQNHHDDARVAVGDQQELDQWIRIDSRRTEAITRALLLPVIDLGFRLKSYGQESVPSHGAALICPNHASYMDPFLHARPQRRIFRFMAKSQLFDIPVVGRLVRSGGGFPVHRGERDEFAIELARQLLRDGQVVCLYPEGTRYRSAVDLGPPRSGAARLAIETGVPVIPVASWGNKPRKVRGERGLPIPKVTTVYGEPMRFPGVELSVEGITEVRESIWREVHRLYGIARELHQRRPRRFDVPPATGLRVTQTPR